MTTPSALSRAFPPVHVEAGLVTLGSPAVRLRDALDAVFTGWADRAGAERVLCPPLASAADLADFDYFVNFPHLALAAAPVDTSDPDTLPGRGDDASLSPDRLGSTALLLPSAACYNLYSALRGARLDRTVKATTIAQCFRREKEYQGLRRLHGFTMREIVAIGGPEDVQAHLERHAALIGEFADHLGLDLATEVATDPFFDPDGSRAVMQRLFPVKQEFVTADGVAIASVNHHRNFFGERADLRVEGETAHTACVAFGVERWLHALQTRFAGDWDAACDAVRAYPGARA
ncbi:aminoacyl--tRNA ligase-related protein [Actinocorallia populi]|uniref:aminoacyl--tRNA ligase-related protein n=1 Tax=Actinocorallia populi TaxID=2079200 RepID=UPI000D094792|nr:aminoacyl--tRNA ligase-related protein [Actinocorallia populi]